MSYFWFEIRYLIASLPTFVLLVQFKLLFWLDRFVPTWTLAPFIVIFVVQDVIYNAIVGTWLFWEKPKEWLFTDRLKRLDEAEELPGCLSRFKLTLNEIDPGHV